MVWFKRLGSWAETINTYYEFALLALAFAVFVTRHSRVAEWLLIIALPILGGWTGYLFRTKQDSRDNLGGFHLISNVMTYEVGRNNRYVLRYDRKLRAMSDHLMVYPIGYQWTGAGEESIPKVTGTGQRLLGPIKRSAHGASVKAEPYESTAVSADDRWHYWFVAFDPALSANDVVEVHYSQEFYDKKRVAKPYLYYSVRVPIDHLELRVKFSPATKPAAVKGSYVKPFNPARVHTVKSGVVYDPETLWAHWSIDKPKKGYVYRLHW